MYVGPNLGSAHLLLFGGAVAQQVNDRLSWGIESLDVFDRPIASAAPIAGGLADLFTTKPTDSLLEPGGKPPNIDDNPSLFGGYFDWVERMRAFREAATVSLQTQQDATAEPAAESGTTLGFGASSETGDTDTGSTQTDQTEAATNSTTPDSSSGSGSSTGVLGGLLGGLFGG